MIEHMFDHIVFETEEAGYEAIPSGLDAMAPGPQLAAMLARIDVGAVSGYDCIVVLQAHQRMVSHYQAQIYADMATIVDAVEDVEECVDKSWAPEMAAAEIRVALRLTRRAADSELKMALALRERYPRVWAALASGQIDRRRAGVIRYGTIHLTDQAANTVVDAVLERAAQLTTGQLAALIRRLGIEVDPEAAQSSYQTALEQRRVVTEATEEGTVNLLGFDLAPHRVATASRRINLLARTLKTSDDTRTMDQLRADILLDLLNGKHTTATTGAGSDRGEVDIHVDLTTLAELTEQAGDLDGYGPVIADIARQVTEQQQTSEWRYAVTHPDTGMPLHVGTTRRRPTTQIRRLVQAHHRTCVFPGCRMPSRDCDLDHRIPWAHGGATRTGCLAPLCRHDHCIRHRGWTYQPLPGGDHLWTSPLGHTHTTSGTPP